MEWWPPPRRRRPEWRRPLPRPRRGSSTSETRRWRAWSQVLTQLPRRRTNRPTSWPTLRCPGPTRSPRRQWRGWRTQLWRADSSARRRRDQRPRRLTSQKQKQVEIRLSRLHSRLSSLPTCRYFLFLAQ